MDLIGRKAQTFAVMYFDADTLDDHDKHRIARLTEKEIMMYNGEEPSYSDYEEYKKE